MRALFIGRFQPFHQGHLKLLRQVSNEYKQIIIGIGSSQYSHTKENPFSAEERQTMIQKSLETADITNYTLVNIPDIHNYPQWVSHVISIVPDFDVVLSNNPTTIRLFKEKDFQVRDTPVFRRDEYSGEEIRRRIANDEEWQHLVPQPVAELIKNVDGVQRIKEAFNKQ